MSEPTLFDGSANDVAVQPGPSPHRVRALAGILAGFALPGRGGYERLTKREREAVEELAREFLARAESIATE